MNYLKNILIILLLWLAHSCKPIKQIVYHYPQPLNIAIQNVITELTKNSNLDRLFIVIKRDIETTLILNHVHKMPKDIVWLVKRTNRFIRIRNKKIPIIFYSDFDAEKVAGHLNNFFLGGYHITFDFNKNIVSEGGF